MNLFEDKGAKFNPERTHRQKLWRVWDISLPKLYVIGMNPSMADETDNDPTVERMERRARRMGYGALIMLNIMDVVETDSRKLDAMPAHHRCSKDNVAEITSAIQAANDGLGDVLCAWGKPGQKYGAVAWLTTQAARLNVTLFCLGMNGDGSPKHPLYVPYSKEFEWFAGTDYHKAAKPLVA